MRRIALSAAALFGLALLAGCVSSEALYEDVHASRTAAYAEWKQQHDSQEASRTRLSGKLTLADGLALALLNNKPLLAAAQARAAARGDEVASYSSVLPKLSGTAGYTRQDKVASFDIGGQTIPLGFVNNFSAGLNVSQPVFRGGAITAQLRSGVIGICLSDEGLRAQAQQTIYDVARGYYDTLLAQELVAVNEEAVKSAEGHLKDVTARRGQGMASEYDVLRAQVDVSNFRAEMIQQQNRVHLAMAALFKTMGVSQDSVVELSDTMNYAPMKPVIEEAVRLAHENRPDLYRAEFGVRLQREALRIAYSRYWPSVDATYNRVWSRPDPHDTMLDAWGSAWNAGVAVTWPIFDGLAREGAVMRERAVLKQRHIELLDAEERALLDVQQAILSIRDAEEFVESQRLNLERAKEGLRLVEVGYREGVNSEVEVTDARSALARAKELHYQAVYQHNVARLDLQRAMGILGPRPGTERIPKEPPVKPSDPGPFGAPPGPSDAPKAGPDAPPAAPNAPSGPVPAPNADSPAESPKQNVNTGDHS